MVTLVCLLVGVKGSVFPVDVDASQLVGHLKDAIKAKKLNTITCDAKELKLYVAKKSGAWLTSSMEEVKQLKKGEKTAAIEEMVHEDKELQGESGLYQTELAGLPKQPSENQIQVLVVVPPTHPTPLPNEKPTMSIRVDKATTTDPQVLEELVYYQQRGQLITTNCHEYCAQILDKIDELYTDTSCPKPFICVQGSSGMGKTQLAFALQGRRPWVYMLASAVGTCSQLIYQNFEAISCAFHTVVARDGPTERKDYEVFNSRSSLYWSEELWMYGFLCALLEHCSLPTHQETKQMVRFDNERTIWNVRKCDRQVVVTVIRRMALENKELPFLILDELSATTKSSSDNTAAAKMMAAFQRNVFRACGLVVLVMGTDATISQLMAPWSGASYSHPCQWVTIVSRFPCYQLLVAKEHEHMAWSSAVARFPVLETTATNSRGRFARLFIEKVVTTVVATWTSRADDCDLLLCDLLDLASANVSLKTHFGKQFLHSVQGKHLQRMAISSFADSVHSGDDDDQRQADGEEPPWKTTRSMEAMHLHFANLVDEQLTQLAMSRGELRTTSHGEPPLDTNGWFPRNPP